jgi:hypothetical protein
LIKPIKEVHMTFVPFYSDELDHMLGMIVFFRKQMVYYLDKHCRTDESKEKYRRLIEMTDRCADEINHKSVSSADCKRVYKTE